MLFVLPLSEALKNAAFGLALALWVLRVLIRRERVRISPLGWGLLAFLAVAAISALGGLDRYQAARGAWDIFRYVFTFFLMFNGPTSVDQARWCLGALLVSVVLAAVVGLGQYWAMEKTFISARRLISRAEADAKGALAGADSQRRSMNALILARLESGDPYQEIRENLGVDLRSIAKLETSFMPVDKERIISLRGELKGEFKSIESFLKVGSPESGDEKRGQGVIDRSQVEEVKRALVVKRAFNRGTMAVRVHSVGHPNHSATYLVMMLGLALAGALERSFRPGVRVAFAGMVALLVVATVFTYSRAGMVLMVLVTVGMLLLTRRGRWVAGLAVLALALLALPRVRATIPQVAAAVQQPMKVGEIYDRVHVWRTVVFGVVRDRPLLGAGPRSFNFINKRQYNLGSSWDYFDHAHSLYMNVAAEMGTLGLGALFVWLGLFLRAWWTARRRLAYGLARLLWLGSGGAFLTLTVSGLITTTLHTEGAMLVMAIWGLFFYVHLAGEDGRSTSAADHPPLQRRGNKP
ncbi:MAG: O-antigen ligase family protein [bacterium]|nr:O-antigen ligase family protein [bacterium]